jgi:hypothetical protein
MLTAAVAHFSSNYPKIVKIFLCRTLPIQLTKLNSMHNTVTYKATPKCGPDTKPRARHHDEDAGIFRPK